MSEAKSAEDACQSAAQILAANKYDLPFTIIYLLDADGKLARLAGATGLQEDLPDALRWVDMTESVGAAWPLRNVMATGNAEVVADLSRRLGVLPPGVWPESPKTAVVLPMGQTGQDRPAGFLVAGVNPRRPLDDQYHGFFELVASQIATSIANARAYEEERKRTEALAEIDRAKTAFFSNVSHEFRTPLTLILGPAEEMLSGALGETNEIQRAHLTTLRHNAVRLQKLVNTLLDFARVEAGRTEATYEPVDIGLVTRDLAGTFCSAVQRAGLLYVMNCPSIEEPVYIDRDMWEKIVLNLLSNALKFTFEGVIEVSIKSAGDQIVFAVRDTGVGIADEEQPRLFDRFYRVRGSRSRTHEGSGIGLALVQELVKLHGGSLQVESGRWRHNIHDFHTKGDPRICRRNG